MHYFDSEGVQIAYERSGTGAPLLLLHGFAASFDINWTRTGWVEALLAADRDVVGIDCRGHGKSDKPHDPTSYCGGQMPADVLRLLDHLSLERVDVFGYSMGAWLMLPLLTSYPDRFNAVVLAGAGAPMPETTSLHAVISAVMAGTPPPQGSSQREIAIAHGFREFAAARGNDLRALTCVLRSGVLGFEGLSSLKETENPVLVIGSDCDPIAGDIAAMQRYICGSRLVLISGTDHLTTLFDAQFRDSVLRFLEEFGI